MRLKLRLSTNNISSSTITRRTGLRGSVDLAV
jgi:hypothetical protein